MQDSAFYFLLGCSVVYIKNLFAFAYLLLTLNRKICHLENQNRTNLKLYSREVVSQNKRHYDMGSRSIKELRVRRPLNKLQTTF